MHLLYHSLIDKNLRIYLPYISIYIMLKLFVYDSIVESWMFKHFFSFTEIILHNMNEEAKLKEFLYRKEEYYKHYFGI